MLDTTIVLDLVRNPQGKVCDKVLELGSDAMCISIITAAELRYGCAKQRSGKLLRQVEAIMEGLDILPLQVPADAIYGKIRAELAAEVTAMSANDLLVAAHVTMLDAVLVTARPAKFLSISGLRLENWLA